MRASEGPLNLKQMYGDKYRVELDGAAQSAWHLWVLCKFGHIYPYSGKLLAYFCESGGIRAKLKRDHPEIECPQWGDDGVAVFLFTPDQFGIIAEYAKPKKRRKLSAEHKAKLLEASRDHQFSAR